MPRIIEALIRMAELLGRKAQTQALAGRLEAVQKGLAGMWDEQSGIYLNLHTDDGSPDRQISPTLLYPLLVEGLPKRNARRMVEEHLLNPDELWGEWVIPSHFPQSSRVSGAGLLAGQNLAPAERACFIWV